MRYSSNASHPPRDLLEKYAGGHTSEPETVLVEEHLVACEHCQLVHDEIVSHFRVMREAITEFSAELQPKTKKGFDVFLCYKAAHRAGVKKIGRQLRQRGLEPWYDEEQLRPGYAWQAKTD